MKNILYTVASSVLFTSMLSLHRGVGAFVHLTWKRASINFASRSATKRSLSTTSSSDLTEFDVIVVGGGHAGCDAAAASARTGAKTALVTQRLDTIGELSCNPSIGGIGKGHLVREVDALDGLIGKVADEAGIHYRVLNRRKGPAVRGPRAQMDRDLYKAAMQSVLSNYENLSLVEASVQDLLLDESKSNLESLAPVSADNSNQIKSGLLSSSSAHSEKIMNSVAAQEHHARIRGVVVEKSDGTTVELQSRAVVITTGTFLRGVLMLGHDRYVGGRHLRDSEEVEPPSVGLAQTLARFNFPLGRLKTGTPPRLDGRTIDWDACPAQPSEVPATPFSHILQFNGEQPPMISSGQLITCHQSRTNDETHRIVMENEHTLPRYDGGGGDGTGPRYCPSIYKKVQRFPERQSHNCFLEPEGLNTDIVYPNGMSGPYPEEIQLKIMRSMTGLEQCEIIRPGYDVEYDFVNPKSLTHTLETKSIGGLYLAGQICGTTGYEEAAAQGILAGANAGRAAGAAARGEKPPTPFVIGRDEGYIGVLVDDLVTRGTSEPYRMFTSRAEYRISLRADNADIRLTRRGIENDIVRDDERIAALEAREYIIEDRIKSLRKFKLKVTDWAERGDKELMGGANLGKRPEQTKSAEEVLNMPHVQLKDVEDVMVAVQNEELDCNPEDSENASLREDAMRSPQSVYDTVEASVKYQSYVQRQHRDMESWRKSQGFRIPPDVIYEHRFFPTLTMEEVEKLNKARPNTMAEASEISGIRPQSLIYLYHHVRSRQKKRDGRQDVKAAEAAA